MEQATVDCEMHAITLPILQPIKFLVRKMVKSKEKMINEDIYLKESSEEDADKAIQVSQIEPALVSSLLGLKLQVAKEAGTNQHEMPNCQEKEDSSN